MNRWMVGCLGALAFAAAGSLATIVVGWLRSEQVTTCRLSPDETLRVWLVELHSNLKLDRNLAVRLENLKTQETRDLLPFSPDEGTPEGTERFVWSKDGTKILLVGRHFFVRDDMMLEGGNQAYFIHDIQVGRSWINSADNDRFPPLTADLLAGVEFTEPVVLKPRPKVNPDSPKKRE